jgi:hypothetical protein
VSDGGSEVTVELPLSSWRSLKAQISGRLGELFALLWLVRQRVPEDEIWGLRRSWLESSRKALSVRMMSPSEEPGAWREFSFPVLRLLDAMSPPSVFSFFGLPRSFWEELKHLLSAWVPRKEELDEVAQLILAFSERREWPWLFSKEELTRELKQRHPGVEAERALRAEIARAVHMAAGFAAQYVVVTPASEFRALNLFLKASYAGDFVLLKWRRLRRLAKAAASEAETPKVSVVVQVPMHAQASWVIEVEPREARFPIFHALRSSLGGAAELRWRGERLYVYGVVGKEALEKALEQARGEAQAELERRLRLIGRLEFLRSMGFTLREGVEVWEGELKGVEVVEVKAGAGKLSKPQKYMLGKLREEAERAREILGRPVEVSCRVVRVELEGFEVPKRARVSSETLF